MKKTTKRTAQVNQMILRWLKQDGGQPEKTAKFIAYKLGIGSIGQAREWVYNAILSECE